MLQVFLRTMSIHQLWGNTCLITMARWVWKKVVLAFKGQSKQWRSSSFAEQHRVLHSKYKLANLLIPSHSCRKQVLHEYKSETIHVFTILNEIVIRLSSWSFLWHLKCENSCMCQVIKFSFGSGTWIQHTALRLRPEGISTCRDGICEDRNTRNMVTLLTVRIDGHYWIDKNSMGRQRCM